MKQYATIEDMERARGADHILALSDKDRTGGRIDLALNEALERASSLADSYIDKKYAVPLQDPPDFLVAAVIDVAEYQLAPDSMIGTDAMYRRYNDAIKLFEKIGAGKVTLAGNEPAASSGTDPATGAVGSKGVKVIAKKRYFTRDSEIL